MVMNMSMTKDARKCSHCGHIGHNSRTCNRFKLFGEWIENNNSHQLAGEASKIRKSKSMGNLEKAIAANDPNAAGVDAGYLSDGPLHSPTHRKKGISWTEDEHRSFLIGLERLGKGDWRGISKTYVPTRTPTQVASHAQKYFKRIASNNRKIRRPSVFDAQLNDLNSQTQSSASVSVSNKAPEVLKEATTAPLEQLFDTCTIRGKVASTNCERPPLSPMTRPSFAVPDLRHMPYMIPSNVHSYNASKIATTISWIPVLNVPNQSHVHFGNFQGAAGFGPFATRPSLPLMQPPPLQIQSQVAAAVQYSTPVANKDGVNISIGAL